MNSLDVGFENVACTQFTIWLSTLQVFYHKCYQANHMEFSQEADHTDTLAKTLVVGEFIARHLKVVVMYDSLNCIIFWSVHEFVTVLYLPLLKKSTYFRCFSDCQHSVLDFNAYLKIYQFPISFKFTFCAWHTWNSNVFSINSDLHHGNNSACFFCVTMTTVAMLQEFSRQVGPLVSNATHVKTLVGCMNVILTVSTLPIGVWHLQWQIVTTNMYWYYSKITYFVAGFEMECSVLTCFYGSGSCIRSHSFSNSAPNYVNLYYHIDSWSHE